MWVSGKYDVIQTKSCWLVQAGPPAFAGCGYLATQFPLSLFLCLSVEDDHTFLLLSLIPSGSNEIKETYFLSPGQL